MIRSLLISFLLLFSSDCFAIPAFPGAEGGGAESVGGRGGSVIQVTNLSNSGSGSFRAACEASGARTIVFTTGGTISLSSAVTISNPYITIAGQTAPGGGICFKGSHIHISTHDIIIQYIRVRPGIDAPLGYDGIVITSGYNIIIDHCSVSWARDENISANKTSISNPLYKVTTSYNIISEGLDNHSCGYLAFCTNGANVTTMTDLDVHHNLFAHNNNRNPLFKCETQRIVNNLIYNWGWWATGIHGGVNVDIIGNKYKAGGDSPVNRAEIPWREDWVNESQGPSGNPTIYVDDNTGHTVGTQWDMVERTAPTWTATGASPNATFERGAELSALTYPITASAVSGLETLILSNIGAYQQLNEDGYWVANRDSVDARIVQDYNAGTGAIISDEDNVGGYPSLAAGTPYTDADQDGMPAAWETYMGLDDGCATDRNGDLDGDNYTNLEEFLSGDRTPPAAEGFVTQGFTFTGFTINLGI